MIRPRSEEDLEHAIDDTRARPRWREALGVGVEELAIVSRFFVSPEVRGRGVGFYERRGWRRVGNAELELSAEPWRLDVVLFVLS